MVGQGDQSVAHQRLLREYRLRTSADFDRVFANKCSVADQCMVVYVHRNEVAHPRLGLVVSRKVGNAVCRNRWKRLIREAFRLQRESLPAVDLVVIPRPQKDPKWADLRRSLRRLAKRAERKLR